MKKVSILLSLSLSFVTVGSYAGNSPFKSCLEPSDISYQIIATKEGASVISMEKKLEAIYQKYKNFEGNEEGNKNTLTKDLRELDEIEEYYASERVMGNLGPMGLSSSISSDALEKNLR